MLRDGDRVTLVASRLSGFATLSLILELVAIHFPWDLRDVPDGRGGGAAADVSGNPVADRPAAGTARAGMTGTSGQMIQTTMAELCLEEGLHSGFWLREAERLAVLAVTESAAIEFRFRGAPRDGRSRPTG